VRAAEDLDRLAETLAAAGRTADACDAARRALELAESRERRRLVRDLVDQLRASPADAPVIAALERALGVMEPAEPERVAGAPGGSDHPGVDDPAAPQPAAADASADDGASADGSVPADDGAPADLEADTPDAVALADEAEAAFDAGDIARARDGWLRAAAEHRRAGHRDAAIDACYLALGVAPDDPLLHLALAELYVERGWRTHAADKLVLLARLADLNDDPGTRARLCALAVEHVPEDPRLREICA
jgi:tetratricopeptide (TPR) repeat protein